MFWKFFIALAVSVCFLSNCEAQNYSYRPHINWNNHYYYAPSIGYQPQVQWYFRGSNMNFGPVVVSPCKKYVQFGIYGGYYVPKGYTLFDPRTGQYRYYR